MELAVSRCMGVNLVGAGLVKERDSSSWKYSVGNGEPLMRLIPMEPSMVHWSSVGNG